MATTVTITKGLIGKEDISFEDADTTPSTFTRTAAGGTTQAITKLAAAHLKIEDANSRITADNVETALQELALGTLNLQVIATAGKGSDIASAATIALPGGELLFDVTGTTNITAITINVGGAAGRLIVLQFDSTLTVKESSTLRLDGDFEARAGDQIMLIYDGTNWREISRTTGHGVTLHGGPLVQRNNEELGDAWISGDGDLWYSAGNPLNGFIGGQGDRAF